MAELVHVTARIEAGTRDGLKEIAKRRMMATGEIVTTADLIRTALAEFVERGSSSRYTASYGPNVEQVLCQGSRVVRGKIPSQVRKELREAVKAGVLGHLKRDGLKPEIFFHPDHRHGAIERQKREAEYSIDCIAKVLAVKPVEQRIAEAFGDA